MKNRNRVSKGVKKVNEQQKKKVYYFKNNEILFEDRDGVVKLKEFHHMDMNLYSPFSEDEAKYIAHIRKAFLKIRR